MTEDERLRLANIAQHDLDESPETDKANPIAVWSLGYSFHKKWASPTDGQVREAARLVLDCLIKDEYMPSNVEEFRAEVERDIVRIIKLKFGIR